MIKKVILALTLVLSIGMLTACGTKDVDNKVVPPIQTETTTPTDVTEVEEPKTEETTTEPEGTVETEEPANAGETPAEGDTISPYDVEQQTSDVTLSVKENEITPETKTINFTYTNTTDKSYLYGKQPHLEIKVEDKWTVVPTLDVAWDAMAYAIAPNSTVDDILDIEFNYGKLETGNYRFVKPLFSDNNEESTFVVVEFEVK